MHLPFNSPNLQDPAGEIIEGKVFGRHTVYNPLSTSGTGTVTSVNVSGGTTGLTASGGPITTAGTITLGGDLVVANGGTGVATLTVYAPLFGGTTATGPIQSGTVGTAGQVLTSNGAGALPTFQAISGAGTVTSVALALPSFITVSGSPVTTSGTLTGTLATQTANFIFAGPTTGAAAAPTFRALVAADVPTLAYVRKYQKGANWTNAPIAIVSTDALTVFVQCPTAGTITAIDILTDNSVNGSCVVDVWKTNAGYPSVGNTIVSGTKPTITAAKVLTGYSLANLSTTTIAANDWLGFHLDSSSSLVSITPLITIQAT